jgi:hypothetical protein
MTDCVNYHIKKLVADAYMTNATTSTVFEGDLIGVMIKKEKVDQVYLFVNHKQLVTIKIKGTQSHIISMDQAASEYINYLVPFAQSLGLAESTTLRCFLEQPQVS